MQLSWLLAPTAALAALTLSPLESQAQSLSTGADRGLSVGAFATGGGPHAGCPFQHRAVCTRGHCCPGACCGGGHDLTGVRGVTTAAAATLLGAAVTLTVLAFNAPAQPLPNGMDSGLVSRNVYEDMAIGFFIGGGLAAIAATLAWVHPNRAHPAAYAPPAVAFGVSPHSMGLTLRF